VIVGPTGGAVEHQRIKTSEVLAYCQLRGISVPSRKAKDLEYYIEELDDAYMKARGKGR
jgi:hypothetical protein